ncbi:MAG: penicillin-binding protein 1C, partial [Steroidobacteraceae bacterium]|nr:penicillin-binding protein 1C [Steroidobacteraceae bacterium]MDW8258928.1 penicillin-binding protein 1C [Gammaproteobacteria bacterium]
MTRRDAAPPIAAALAALAGIAALAATVGVWRLAPRPLLPAPLSTVLLARDGSLLGARIAADGQWRFPPLASVPDKFRSALLAFEDRRFAEHRGVDWLAVARAAGQNLKARRVVSGGSTLTMQLARLVRTAQTRGTAAERRRARTLRDKAIEALLALRLELQYSKAEILALYASHAPFGGNVVGLEAAAWRYFGRAPAELSWAEAATLAVLPNAPALVTPGRNRLRLQRRRDALLLRLAASGVLDRLDLKAALAEPLVGAPLPLPNDAPHYLDTLRRRTPDRHRLHSTLDATLQRQAVELVRDHARELERQNVHNVAALVLDNRTFDVLAYVGNAEWSLARGRGFAVDIVQRPRSTGSILKPFLYAALLDSGQLLPRMLVADVPTQIAGYMPENFDRQYRGAVPADVALAQSLNVPAVRLLQQYGVERFYDALRARGFSTLVRPPSHYGLTLVLGGAEGTLWDITHLYARLVADARGADPRAGAGHFSPGAAWLTLQALL